MSDSAWKEVKFFDGSKFIEETTTQATVTKIIKKYEVKIKAPKNNFKKPRLEVKNLLTQRTEYIDL